MTDKEQVIIDGVDVSGCEYLKYDKIGCYADDCYCMGNDCYYKQLKGLDKICLDGCEWAKQEDEGMCDIYKQPCHEIERCYFKQLARKTQECEELKKRALSLEEIAGDLQMRNHMLTYENQEKIKENEFRQKILDELGSECKRISKNYKEDEDRYRKALEEIEGLATNLRTRTDYHSEEEVNADIENILDIIRKAKGEE